MNAFAKMVDGLTRVCTILALISMLAMMALITGDVIMNKVASRPIPGTIEITSFYFMVSVVFLALPFVEKRNAHIAADVITSRLSPAIQRVFTLCGRLLTIIFYGLLSYKTLQTAISSTEIYEEAMSNFVFYIWPSRWIVFLGFVVAVLAALMAMFSNKTPRPTVPAGE